MATYPDWSDETEMLLTAAGWHAGRRQPALVERWRQRLGAFPMSAAARDTLEEFGGLRVEQSGPGLTCARSSFVLNPDLASGEDDQFAWFEHVVRDLFPLGEVDSGHAFLAIDPAGRVYMVGDFIAFVGANIRVALDNLLLGRMPEFLADT